MKTCYLFKCCCRKKSDDDQYGILVEHVSVSWQCRSEMTQLIRSLSHGLEVRTCQNSRYAKELTHNYRPTFWYLDSKSSRSQWFPKFPFQSLFSNHIQVSHQTLQQIPHHCIGWTMLIHYIGHYSKHGNCCRFNDIKNPMIQSNVYDSCKLIQVTKCPVPPTRRGRESTFHVPWHSGILSFRTQTSRVQGTSGINMKYSLKIAYAWLWIRRFPVFGSKRWKLLKPNQKVCVFKSVPFDVQILKFHGLNLHDVHVQNYCIPFIYIHQQTV